MATITDVALRKAKAHEKPYKIAAGNGLYLLVNPTGSKLWRWKHRVAGNCSHLTPTLRCHFRMLVSVTRRLDDSWPWAKIPVRCVSPRRSPRLKQKL